MTRGIHYRQPLKRKLVGLMTVYNLRHLYWVLKLTHSEHFSNGSQFIQRSLIILAPSHYLTSTYCSLPPYYYSLPSINIPSHQLLPLYLPKIKNHTCDKCYTQTSTLLCQKGKYTLFYVRLFVNQLPAKTFHSFHLNKRPVKHVLVIMLFMSNKYSFAWAFCCRQFATTFALFPTLLQHFLQEHEDCKKLESWGASLARAVQEYLFTCSAEGKSHDNQQFLAS